MACCERFAFCLGRLLKELHHRLCLRICSKHPFSERINGVPLNEVTGSQQDKTSCVIPNGLTNGSSGDSGSGSLRRYSMKSKIVRGRRVFGDSESDDDEDDDHGGRGAGDGIPYANESVVVDSDNEASKGFGKAELDETALKMVNGQTGKSGSDCGVDDKLSEEGSDGLMSSSSGWSSSSDEEDDSDDEASDELFDSEGVLKTAGKKSQEDLSEGREKGGAGKMPPPRLSPFYTLDKALSCRQLVKQVASEELLSAAKLFLDWLLLLSNDTWRSEVNERNRNNTKAHNACGLPLRIIKYVTDLSNLLCVVKYRVMRGSDSTIEHVRSKLNELSTECNTKKVCDGDEFSSLAEEEVQRKELILPEDIHFPLEAAPALKAFTAAGGSVEKPGVSPKGYGRMFLSWDERSILATEGQRAVYRMHLIPERAAAICEPLEGATVIRGERITFVQRLQDEIMESISREATPSVQTGSGGTGGQNGRGRNGRSGKGGGRGERGAGDSEKQQIMMKSMAHAWLRHEVEGLEERLEGSAGRNGVNGSNHDTNGYSASPENNINQHGRGNGAGYNASNGGTMNGSNNGSLIPMASLSPFVVVDSSALATRLAAVRAIAVQKKSILLVPTCVLSHLDEMKKDVPQARDATRWLETEMRKGSRFVQVLGPGEASKISLLKYPKRKDREAWHLFQLLECCHHLGNGGATNHGIAAGKHSKQDGSHRNSRSRRGIAAGQGGTILVSLLVARAESDLPPNSATLADAIGVKLIDIDELFGKATHSARHTPEVGSSARAVTVATSENNGFTEDAAEGGRQKQAGG